MSSGENFFWQNGRTDRHIDDVMGQTPATDVCPIWYGTKEIPLNIVPCIYTRCSDGLECMWAIRKSFTVCFANSTACIPSLSKPTASSQTTQPYRHAKSETSSLARENSFTAFPLGQGSSVAYSICSVMFYYLVLWHLLCYFSSLPWSAHSLGRISSLLMFQ